MLANLKPFISIAYDMNSSALLEIFWADAAVLSVPLWRLQEETTNAEVSRIVRNLNRNEEALVHSMANLRSHFDSEYAAFESAFRQALGFE